MCRFHCVFQEIVTSDKYGNKTCILSVLARQVHVVYAYMIQGLFLNVVSTRQMYSSEFSFSKTLSGSLYACHVHTVVRCLAYIIAWPPVLH